ncbi:MAG: transglycosylase domain-containing protein [Oligoflexales bacterium]|nr:transglycosylase domain-containing protein [Oligoflexales bacterium]
MAINWSKAGQYLKGPHSFKKKLCFWFFSLFFTLLIATYIIIPPIWLLKWGSIEIVQWPRTGQQVTKVGPNEKNWVKLSTVSRHVINAIIVAEDARFYNHDGVDFTEVFISLRTNIEKRRHVRGASTITQQVVKNAFLSREKSYTRKFREALGAIALELIMSKNDIMEWYINITEFGGGVYGIRSAANFYFNTKPELLTIQEGANLALVIPSPNGWAIGLKQKRLTEFGHARYAQIINRMYQNKLITNALKTSALATGDFGRPVKAYLVDEHEAFQDSELFLNDNDPAMPQKTRLNPKSPIKRSK